MKMIWHCLSLTVTPDGKRTEPFGVRRFPAALSFLFRFSAMANAAAKKRKKAAVKRRTAPKILASRRPWRAH